MKIKLSEKYVLNISKLCGNVGTLLGSLFFVATINAVIFLWLLCPELR